MGTASKAGISVPVTPVAEQSPAVTVPPTKHPAEEPLHEVKRSTYVQAVVGTGVPAAVRYAVFHAVCAVITAALFLETIKQMKRIRDTSALVL